MSHNYALRREKLQEMMKELALDAYLVHAQDSIYYLTGATYQSFERPYFLVIYPETHPDLVVPALERTHMRKVRGFNEPQTYAEFPAAAGETWYDSLNSLIGGIPILGVEPTIPAELASKLTARNVITSGLVSELRRIKSEEEIQSIRTASSYADQGMSELLKCLYSGISVAEVETVAQGIKAAVVKAGDFDPLENDFLTTGWPASKSAQPLSVPAPGEQLRDGPIVLVSRMRVGGYSAECERTVFLEPPSGGDRELFNHVERARDIAFAMVRPGVPCADVDSAVRAYFEEQGLLKYVLHRTGHGIGLLNNEAPYLGVGSTETLAENMVVTVEPALYVPRSGGYRLSDTVLVTESGCECLTRHPTTLAALTVQGKSAVKALKGNYKKKAFGIMPTR